MSTILPYEKDPKNLDFSIFVTEPVIPYDIELTNKKFSFKFHKAVLSRISSVFKDMINDDPKMSKIEVPDVTSKALEVLQIIVYTPSQNRTFEYYQSHMKVGGSSIPRMLIFVYRSIFRLVANFNILFLEDLLLSALQKIGVNCSSFVGIIDCAEQMNRKDFSSELRKIFVKRADQFKTLEDIPAQMCEEIMNTHDDDHDVCAKLLARALKKNEGNLKKLISKRLCGPRSKMRSNKFYKNLLQKLCD